MSRPLHVVFETLNFVYGQSEILLKLQPIDKHLLILLSRHAGPKGIFPMQETLANELKIKVRHTRERLKYLQEIGLISYSKIGRKYHYELKYLSTTPAPECLYDSDNTGTTMPLSYTQHRHCDVTTPALARHNSGTVVPTINIEDQYRLKEEREPATAPPSPPVDNFFDKQSFSYTAEEQQQAIRRDIDIQKCINKFCDYIQKKGRNKFKREEWEKWFAGEKNGSGAKQPLVIVNEYYERQMIKHEEFKRSSGMPQGMKDLIAKIKKGI